MTQHALKFAYCCDETLLWLSCADLKQWLFYWIR